MNSSQDFKRIVDNFLSTAEHPNVDFYLILPVQRLPRYEMLLKEILKYTEEDDVDWPNLQAALEKVKETNDFVNEKKKEDQTRRKIADIQSSIIAKEPLVLVQRGRVLVREGAVFELTNNNKKKKGFYYFLFNDCLIKTKPHSYDKKTNTHQYQYIKRVNLHNANIVDVPTRTEDELMFLFLLVEQGIDPSKVAGDNVHYFYCMTTEEKQEWIKDLQGIVASLKGGGAQGINSTQPFDKNSSTQYINLEGNNEARDNRGLVL